MNPRKIAFLATVGVVVIIVIIMMMKLNGLDPKKDTKALSWSLDVWVVGMETPGFSEIIEGFKKSVAKEYNNLTIRFTNFGSYTDYEKNLLNVIADGNSPDIFIVPSDGGKLLESKIDFIPSSIIDVNDFSKRFPLFDDLVVREKGQGDALPTQYLKGVPLGYESMWLFYNFKLVRQIPLLWADLDQKIQSENTGSWDERAEYSLIALGLGSKYIIDAPDVVSLFLAQNGIKSIDKIDDPAAINALDTYGSYAKVENNGISNFVTEMNDLHLSSVDLFVRGKIGMLVGTPSLLREIAFALKRSSSESVLNPSFLRTASIPQITDNKENAVNLMRYAFFGVSKNAKNSLLAARFVAYLATKEAQESFMKYYPYYLPALQELEEKRIGEPILPEGTITFKNAKYGDFILSKGSYVSFDKGLKTEYERILGAGLDAFVQNPKELLTKIKNQISCEMKHLIEKSNFDQSCE